MPKVSVCIPAYENPQGIRRLLTSVKEQSFTDYEVIVTDDSQGAAVEQAVMESGMNRVHYFKNEKRLGATENWNEAVRRSSGEYIKMMHHDDWFSGPDSLERFAGLLDGKPEAALAFSGTWQVELANGRTEEKTSRHISAENEALVRSDWRNLFLGNFIGAPSAVIYRRSGQVFEKRLTWVMDVEYYMRLLRDNHSFACTREPLVCIGVSEDQLTERCRTDGQLNLYEYGFLFREFDLSGEDRYCDRLIEICLKYKQPWAALKEYGIDKSKFDRALAEKRRADFRFLLGAAIQKLFGTRKKQ